LNALMFIKVWINGGAVAFSACFSSTACTTTVSAVSALTCRSHLQLTMGIRFS
jgi:hypothetical protein